MLESEGWIDFQAAMNLLANSTGSLLIARRDLVSALKAGRIQSAATKKVRHPKTDEVMFEHDHLLDASHWDMDRLLAELLAAADAQDEVPTDQLKAVTQGYSVRPPEDIRLWERDFVSVFPNAGQIPEGREISTNPPVPSIISNAIRSNTGGRPAKYDWEGAMIEMARVAILEEDSSRPALTRAVLDWFVRTHGSEPPQSQVRAKVKLFHETIWPPPKT